MQESVLAKFRFIIACIVSSFLCVVLFMAVRKNTSGQMLGIMYPKTLNNSLIRYTSFIKNNLCRPS